MINEIRILHPLPRNIMDGLILVFMSKQSLCSSALWILQDKRNQKYTERFDIHVNMQTVFIFPCSLHTVRERICYARQIQLYPTPTGFARYRNRRKGPGPRVITCCLLVLQFGGGCGGGGASAEWVHTQANIQPAVSWARQEFGRFTYVHEGVLLCMVAGL